MNIKVETQPSVIVRGNTHPLEWLTDLGADECTPILERIAEIESKIRELSTVLEKVLFDFVQNAESRSRSAALNIKRALHGPPKALAAGWIEKLAEGGASQAAELCTRWQTLVAARAEVISSGAVAYRTATDRARERLRSILAEPLVREGIYLSSGELYEAVQGFIAASPGKSWRQLERSAFEHLSRSCAKTTPRGVLAGVAIERLGKPTSALLPKSGDSYISQVRALIHLPVLNKICARISNEGAWRRVIPKINSTLWYEEDRVVFWKGLGDLGAAADQKLSLPRSELLDSFITIATRRELTAEKLIDAVSEEMDGEFDAGELEDYYRKLCDRGILEGGLRIPFGTRDGLRYLIEWLESDTNRGEFGPILKSLLRIQGLLREVESAPGSVSRIESYEKLAALIAGLLGEDRQKFSFSRSIVIDTSPAAVETPLDPKTIRSVIDVFRENHFIARAAGVNYPRKFAAWKFIHQLNIAKDLVGKSEMPLRDLIGAETVNEIQTTKVITNSFGSTLYDWLARVAPADRTDVHSIDLRADGLLELLTDQPPEVKAAHSWISFRVARGPDGARLVVVDGMSSNMGLHHARFARLLDDRACEADLERHFEWLRPRYEGNRRWTDVLFQSNDVPDTITPFSEHQPYAIELFGARSARPASELIPFKDVWIDLSVSNEASLFWKKENENIPLFPYFCSAINTAIAPNPIHLMTLLGAGTGATLDYWWHMPALRHIPRLTIDDTVIRRETWNVPVSEVRALACDDGWKALVEIDRWRRSLNMPRYVFARTSGTRPFFVDFLGPLALDVLFSTLQTHPDSTNLQITEMLPSPENEWRSVDGRRLATEFVLGVQWEAE